MKHLIYIFIFFGLMACKKDPIKYKISGTIINKYTNQPVVNATVKLRQTEINQNALNSNFVPVGETITDAQGKYNFNFEREQILEVEFKVSNDEYYQLEKIINASELSTENTNVYDFQLEAKAWISVRLLNGFPVNGEQLNFYKHNVKESCPHCCTNGYTIVNHTTPDTTFICPVIGDSEFRYSYGEVSENTSVTDSILCPKQDTTQILINY